jgi:hypothetical protein
MLGKVKDPRTHKYVGSCMNQVWSSSGEKGAYSKCLSERTEKKRKEKKERKKTGAKKKTKPKCLSNAVLMEWTKNAGTGSSC